MRSRTVTTSGRREHRRERALALVASRAAARGMAAVLDEVDRGARPQLTLLSAPLATVTPLAARSS